MNTVPVVGQDRFALGPESDPDRYLVDQPVSLGAEGVVYRCRQNGEVRAVKVRQASRSGPERRRRRTLDRLVGADEPGLVGVQDRFVGPPLHPIGTCSRPATVEYLVMEWIDGRTCAEEIRHGTPPSQLVAGLAPVADALDLLNSGALTGGRPVVHGDVKPDNLMFRPEGSAVLVDLGLLRRADVVLTGAGSAGYRPPPGSELAGQPDLYGLAGVVCHAFTGSHPPDEPSALLDELVAARTPPKVRRLIVEARTRGHDSGIVSWLSAVEEAMESGGPERRSWAMFGATFLLICPLVLSGAGAPATNDACDPARWAADADHGGEPQVTWIDTDGDCLHDAYEINAIGSDPGSAVDSEPWLTSAGAQLSYLVEVHQLLRSEIWLDPTVCRPGVWADAAAEWRRSNPEAPRWNDPDGDCLATVHEQLLGTDPGQEDTDGDRVIDSLDPDSSNGLIEPLDIQLSLAGPVASQPAGQPPRLDRPRADGSGE